MTVRSISSMSGNQRIVILGNGLAANLAAAFLQQRFRQLEVVVVGIDKRDRPIVGESTVELTTHFFHAIGLGHILEDAHYHKYGLTYYYKCNPSEPHCREYVVHEAPGIIRFPAYQINRHTFDDSVRSFNKELGVLHIDANVSDVVVAADGGVHEVNLVSAPGELGQSLNAKWIIDATGRSRFLARRLGLTKQSRNQRSTFWIRLEGFDRSGFQKLDLLKETHLCFDSYYATHHLWGKGYWIWLIPLRNPNGKDLISIGVTYRPDLIDREILNLGDFMTFIRKDHPFVTELIESGRVVSENVYRNYMYEASRYYSPNGWFLIGDAAFPSDPINSAGISTIAQQVPQVAAIIEKDIRGELRPEYVDALQMYLEGQLALQDSWSRWYEIMHDPVKFAWTLVANNAAYFHFILPAYIDGAFLDGRFTQEFARMLNRATLTSRRPESFAGLSGMLSARSQNKPLQTYIPNLFSHVINWRLYRSNDLTRSSQAARYFRVMAFLRWRMIRLAGLGPRSLIHCCFCAMDIMRSLIVSLRPGNLLGNLSQSVLSSPWPANGDFLRFQSKDLQMRDERQANTDDSLE